MLRISITSYDFQWLVERIVCCLLDELDAPFSAPFRERMERFTFRASRQHETSPGLPNPR